MTRATGSVRTPKLNYINSTSVVQRVADEMRNVILAMPDKTFFGSEENVSTRFGVSAPTLRQAARLLEHEQLLTIRRGVSGGYYTRSPDMDAVTHIAAIFLRTRRATTSEFLTLMQALMPTLFRLAADCENAALVNQLRTYATSSADADLAEFGLVERNYQALLAEMSGNVPLELIIAIFNSYGVLLPKPANPYDRKLALRFVRLRSEEAWAILDKDIDRALRVSTERREVARKVLARHSGAFSVRSAASAG